MSEPRAFVSFDFDNNQTEKVLFAGQAKKSSPTPFTVEDWSSKSSLPQATWEAEIKKKIGGTNMCIVLVGRHIRTAGGVAKEVAMALSQDVPVFGVYVERGGYEQHPSQWPTAQPNHSLGLEIDRRGGPSNDG